MKLSENGASSSVRRTLTDCAADLPDLATADISTKSSSKSTDSFITFGVQWIRMARYWIFSSKATGQEGSKEVLSQLLEGLRYVPRVIVTDKLRSYSAARTEIMPSVEHVKEVSEQTSGEFTSTDQIAREGDARIQVIGSRAKISIGLRSHFLTLLRGATPIWS